MINITDKSKCCGCHSCFNICPKKAISMVRDEEGFLYPRVDATSCVNCGLCEKVCHFLQDSPKRENKPTTYAAKIKDDEIRNQSSSGGLFSILANYILSKSGVVYGVAMNNTQKSAEFIRVDNIEDLAKLRGSKYLQATIDDAYKQVKEDLVSSRKVLFSGVPCQINGLKLYLGKEYDNLLIVEVICHGTPSPALWEKYFNYLENKYNAKIEKVNFREKRNGWKTFGLTEDGDNISQYLNQHQDPYMQMFLRNYCLRPSCYACKAKELESMADLTIADFWGIQNVVPEMDDDKGTSLVIVHSEKGKAVLEETKDEYIGKEVSFEQGVKGNPSYHSSVLIPKERDIFFKDMNTMEFDQLQDKYCKPIKISFIRRCINKAKNVAKKILWGVNCNSSKFEYGLLIQLKKED